MGKGSHVDAGLVATPSTGQLSRDDAALAALSEAERKTVADYDANAFKRVRGPEYWQQEIEIFSGLLQSGRIIEIGCGNGVEGDSLTKKGFSYVGTDISKGYLESAEYLHPRLELYQMNVYDIKFADNAFDGLWAGNVLYHLPKARFGEALQEIFRVVRHDGLVFITLPVGTEEKMWNKSTFGYESERLFSFYTAEEATSRFLNNGFRIKKLDSKQSNGDRNFILDWMVFYLSVDKDSSRGDTLRSTNED